MTENTELLDEIITGYVPHCIYAFSTPQLLNYLKVGETSRSVNVRLSEWKKLIFDLKLEKDWLAMLPKDAEEQTDFFQDYALHDYFKKRGIQPMDYTVTPGNSKEFYPVTIQDINNGIDEISNDYLSEPPREYTYLSIEDNSRVKEHWKRNQDFSPRENQQAVIDNILRVSQYDAVPKNYLLFAVMRFGKTFVALESAKALDANLTVVVSAKADVKSEWKKNLESHIDFEGYKFLDSGDLENSDTAIQDVLNSDERVVLFLTLQDLNGTDIKEKHKQLFDKTVDVLIVDESHFGARAQSYGQVIHKWVGTGKKRKLKKFDAYEEQIVDDKEDNDEIKGLKNVKAIDASYTLHLSGTPYRILLGNEFDDQKQIVGKVQYEDILDEKAKWYEKFLEEPEWKNPYFGFPQMVRFAFNLSDAAMSKLNALTFEGKTSQLNELFGPLSKVKDEDQHLKFKYEDDVLNILKSLDGSESSKSIFPVLNYEKIKDGKMAHHIVMVLPYKASCDAMAELLSTHKDEFMNFCDYEVINIAGHDSIFNNRRKPATEKIKTKITELSKEGKKTISLTVNKMLTGVTVPQWNTMIFLKDTQSPQEYDQAIYRLQSPYVTTQYDNDGNVVSKEDLKPQTLLIDFSPNRMMSIEQYKAFIFSASEGGAGNDKVEQSLKRQMNSSPVITMNAEKLTQIQPADVLKYVAAYSSEKGIIEEASEISVDLSILENSLLREVIDSESEIGGKSGLKFYQNKDGEDESDKDDVNVGDDNDDSDDDSDDQDESTGKETNFGEDITEKEKIEKKVQNYYLRILFYAFLSEETEINNLTDVINSYDNNQRLARHIGLEKNVLEILAQELRQPYVRSDLDNKISNANTLLADDTVKVSEKVGRAIQSFKRISESEVFTPRRITELMIDGVFNDMDLSDFNEHPKKFIDLTSKSGIYLLVLYEKLLESNVDENIARKSLYAIATSSIAYEFTRKVFELMEFPVENILDIDYASSYDLINENNREYTTDGVKQYYFKGDENMKFDVVVGNPPYNESISATGGNSSLSKQLFPSFIEMATSMGAESVSLITPSRWFTADAQDRSFVKLREYVKNNNHFKKIYSFPNSKQIFPGVEIAGGVSFFIFKSDYEGNVDFIENYSGSEIEASRPLFENGLDIIIPMNELVNILRKVSNKKGFISMTTITKGRNAFGIVGKKSELDKITQTHTFNGAVEVRAAYEQILYTNRENITKNTELIDKWKIFTSKGNGGAGLITDEKPVAIIGEAYIGGPNSICTDSLIPVGNFDTEAEAVNLQKYMKTKFLRCMVGMLKTSQNIYQNVYQFVPLQSFDLGSDIDWTKSIQEIDQQLYNKYSLDKNEINFIEGKVKVMD